MKKRIIFMVINMNIGGTEKALLSMIAEMPKDQYEITILMLEKHGGFLYSIPSNVHIKYLEGYGRLKDLLNKPPHKVVIEHFKKGKLIKGINLASFYMIAKITKDRSFFLKYILRNVPDFKGEYDIAVAYAGPMDFISYFVVNKIKAKKRIQWIHFDITKIGFNKKFALNVYKKIDKLFVVSNEGRQKLISFFPDFANKVDVFSNIVSPELIIKQANKGTGFQDQFDGLRILTVGRLSLEKGQDLAISVLAKLKKNGFNVRWYCIGEGNAKSDYEQLIKRYNVEQDFILLGANANPYSFMKECDIYVQPSKHEGFCITLAEARVLRKPIVTTNFTGAKEQIKHQETGFIVNIDEDQIYNAVKELICNPTQRKELSSNLSNETFESKDIMNQIYDLA